MERKFTQRILGLDPEKSEGRLKIENLVELLADHPYREKIYLHFDIENIKNEYIMIESIDTIYNELLVINKNYKRHKIYAHTKDISVFEAPSLPNEKEKPIIFNFDEYADENGELKQNLKTEAIYDAKNTFLDDYVMTKYANNLFKIGLGDLANSNIDYFKKLAATSDEINKYKGYRLVDHDGITYLRGITSTSKYYEYGVDFTFVVTMIVLHNHIKNNKGVEFKVTSISLSESKLEMIITEKHLRDAGAFGKVKAGIRISTNDLGQGSLNFISTISIGNANSQGFYIFPKSSQFENDRVYIAHTKKPDNAIKELKDIEEVLGTSEEFIKELHSLKTIKSPDELRVKILAKIQSKRSPFRNIKELSDIFGKKLDNEISNLARLLEMCNKAEELHLEYDLKDKLRYIISDVILNQKTD